MINKMKEFLIYTLTTVGVYYAIDVIWEWIEITNNEPTVDSVADSFMGLILSLIITNLLLKKGKQNVEK